MFYTHCKIEKQKSHDTIYKKNVVTKEGIVMIEYEKVVIESFREEVISQFIKEHFVEILNKQFVQDNLDKEKFIEKYFNYDDFNVRKLERWLKGDTIKIKDKYIKDFREMPVLDKIFLNNWYKNTMLPLVINQEEHFKFKLGNKLSKLGLLTIVSNAIDTLLSIDDNNITIAQKIEKLKFELYKSFEQYIDDI